MTPVELCGAVYDAGMTIRADGGKLVLKPAHRLAADLQALLVAHKPELLAFLMEAEATSADLVAAALRACDHFNDGHEARKQMRSDVESTPPHLRADLHAYFCKRYPDP